MADAEQPTGPRRPAEPAVRHSSRSVVAGLWPVALLVLAGIGMVVYGAAVHERDVLVEQELVLPPELAPPPLPGFPPPPELPKTFLAPIAQTEPDLVREITYGGVTRLADGSLKRTYTGEAPSACPT